MSSNTAVIAISVVANILSVVGVVMTNKYIVESDGNYIMFWNRYSLCLCLCYVAGYNFMIFLSFLHFAFTSMGTRVLLGAEVFTYKEASPSAVMPVAVVGAPAVRKL